MKRFLTICAVVVAATGCVTTPDRCTKDEVGNTYYEVCRTNDGQIESQREMTKAEIKAHLKRRQRSEQVQSDLLTNPTMLFIGYDILKSSQPTEIHLYHHGK